MPRILAITPRYAHSFGTFEYARSLVGASGFMPPQGLLVVAAALPADWQVRFVDENVAPATEDDLAWAEVVLLTGMHVQRRAIRTLNERAHAAGLLTVLGGPSVSACPEWYPEVDLLHVGELGDATEQIIERLRRDVRRPEQQEVYRTRQRRPLEDFPVPAYHLLDGADYLFGSLQFSSGCPYRCEFCDIPELYGRSARLKSPEQVVGELDAMLARGVQDLVYFVDDNFIANPGAAVGLLERLVGWQEEHGFPLDFACEASINIVKRPRVLELMREARFVTMFVGIETPEADALSAMGKIQNLRSPLLEAIETINGYGIEVVSGVILGLDTDTPQTYDRVNAFIDASGIPVLTINLLQALPQTPLWRRLEAAGRLRDDEDGRTSNVEFLLPPDVVLDGWRRCVSHAYDPERLFERYVRQIERTFPNRRPLPADTPRARAASLLRGARIAGRVLWRVGIRAPYRRSFWRLVRRAVRARQPDAVLQAAIVGHHLISYARDALAGQAENAFYSPAAIRDSTMPRARTLQLGPAPR